MKKTFAFMSLLLALIISPILLVSCDKVYDVIDQNTYVVTFDSDGGSTVTAQKVIKGRLIIEPKDPTKAGYTFDGWYKDNVLFDFTTVIESDITLKAKWITEIKYTITFDSDGGSEVTAIQVAKGNSTTKPADPTKSGYVFIGWYIGDTLFSFGSPVTSDIAVKAKWMTESEYNKQNLNISIFTIQDRKSPSSTNKTYKWIKDEFGVTFTWDILGPHSKNDKIDSLIASGDLPDLVEVDSEKFQNAGCLRDLKPLIEEYCPNLMKHYSSAWRKMIYQDAELDLSGNIVKEHIYSLPNYGVVDGTSSDNYFNQNAFWIQKRVLKEYGYPQIKTVDEYFNLIEDYYTKYPTTDGNATIPFSIITADWEAFNLWNPPNFLAGYPNDGNGHVEFIDGKYVYKTNFDHENMYKWLKLANSYYKRGLIDPETFTDDQDQYYEKISQGRVLGMFIQGWEFMGTPQAVLYNQGKEYQTYCPLPIVFNENIKPHYRDQSLPNLQRGYGITVKCSQDKAIQILQFMDEMLKEENQKKLYWGFEGEDYLIDDSGRPYRTDKQRDEQGDPYWIEANKATLWAEEAPKLEGTLESGYTRNIDELPWEYKYSQHNSDLELFKAYGVGSYAELMDPEPPKNAGWYPIWQCNPSSQSSDPEEVQAAEAMNSFEQYLRQYIPELMKCDADAFDTNWKTYCSNIGTSSQTYAAFMQKMLDRRVAQFGGY